MGRPVKRDVKGTLVFGDYTTTDAGIKVEAYFGDSLRDSCYIIKQKGSRSYKVLDKATLDSAQCKLVKDIPSSNGEMRIVGYIGGDAGNPATISKLQKRTAIDFNGVRYTWQLENDSSNDYIVLTALV